MAALFVLTAMTALIGYNLIVVATDRETVKGLFSGLDEVVRQTAPALIIEAARQEALARGITDLPIDEGQLQTAVATVIPPGWLDEQAEAAVDGLYDYLETGDPADAAVTLDTRPLLDSLRGAAGQQMVTAVITNLPPCTGVPNFSTVGNVDIPDCLPPGTDVQQMSNIVHTAVVNAIDQNPEIVANAGVVRLPLFGAENGSGLSNERQVQWARWQRNFSLAHTWGWTLWLAPLACLLLIALLVVRSLPTWGHWWGWPLVIAAVTVLFFAIVTPALLTFVARTAVPPPTDPLALPLRQLGLNLITTVADRWLVRVYFQAGILLALGVGLILMAFGVTAVRERGY
ncbi:MAG: hypothetical protein BroJett015_44000 [Chloroflexota bacterium]|nr:MAG: hypothetical protein BroJett015_44000 [Chloroflexota bacterium]